MRIVKKEYEVYSFSELSEGAKEKALEQLYDINVDYEWWDSIYDDAKNIGLEITEFDIYRREIDGRLLDSPIGIIKAIKKDHGEKTTTYKFALSMEKQAQKEARMEEKTGDVDEEFVNEFRHGILSLYLDILRENYDYLTSREAIVETIEANEHEFLKNGKRFIE